MIIFTCPKCGEQYETERRYCWVCNYSFREPPPAGDTQRQRSSQQEQRVPNFTPAPYEPPSDSSYTIFGILIAIVIGLIILATTSKMGPKILMSLISWIPIVIAVAVASRDKWQGRSLVGKIAVIIVSIIIAQVALAALAFITCIGLVGVAGLFR